MTALARLLFPLPAVRRSPSTILLWWERRRLTYNAIVGTTGLVSLATLRVLEWLPPHTQEMRVPWILVVVFGLAANACYTLGFLLEALFHQLWGDDVAPVGPTLFRHGLVFSVGLTLLPILIGWVGYLVTVAQYLLR